MNFIDYRLAIGMLVVAGFKIEWYNNQIIDLRFKEPICCVFRDGTTWKVKEQVVLDYINENPDLSIAGMVRDTVNQCELWVGPN